MVSSWFSSVVVSLFCLSSLLVVVWSIPQTILRNPNYHRQSMRHSAPFRSREQAIQSFFSSSVGAYAGPGLYAIAGSVYQDGEDSFIMYNTHTGQPTTLVPSNGRELTGEELSCLDDVNNIFYLLYEEEVVNKQGTVLVTGLQPFDLMTVQALDPVILPMFAPEEFVGAGQACIADPNTGDLYVWGHSLNNTQLLVRATKVPNQNNLTLTIVKQYDLIDDIPLLAGNPQAFDTKRNVIWVAGEYGASTDNFTVNLFNIDAQTGDILNTIVNSEGPLSSMVYSPSLDALVGMQFDSETRDGTFAYMLTYLDPVTLDVTKTFPAINGWCASYAVSSANVENGIGYYIFFKGPDGTCGNITDSYPGYLVSVDFSTGEIIDEPEFCDFLKSTCPWSLQYWNGQ